MAKDAMTDLKLTEAETRLGAAYLKALRQLGFEPDLFCWALENIWSDRADQLARIEKRLVIVTSLVERVGTRSIYDLLFSAYDLAVTPKEVDPFNVAVYSTESLQGELLLKTVADFDFELSKRRDTGDDAVIMPGGIVHERGITMSKNAILGHTIYASRPRRFTSEQDIKRFDRLKRNVANLEAQAAAR